LIGTVAADGFVVAERFDGEVLPVVEIHGQIALVELQVDSTPTERLLPTPVEEAG
jgi:hypothetical protein